MDEKEQIECDVNFSFQDFLYDVNLWTLIGGGPGVDVLKSVVDAIHNSSRSLKPPRILICGTEGKTTTAHAFINSLAIENVTFIESEFLDTPGFSMSSKFVFRNGFDRSVIIGHIENLCRNAQSNLWQYLSSGKCCYNKLQNGDWEINHYDGVIVLTASKKELIPKTILKQMDLIIELEPSEPHQIRKILEQRLKYLKIGYDEKCFNLLINSCDNSVKKLISLLKLVVISTMSRNEKMLIVSDLEFALEHKNVI